MYATAMKLMNKRCIMHILPAMIWIKILEESTSTKGEHAAKGTSL